MKSLSRSTNQLPVLFLLSLSAYAFYATWGISVLDGTMGRIYNILTADVPLIPGTEEPLRLHFTGIAPIDYWCNIMVLFFWEVVDGSHPATSMTGVYFLGQLVGVWTLMYVEGVRIENKGHVVARALLWVLLMQNLTLGCFGPIYFALHLGTARYTSVAKEEPPTVLAAAHNLRVLPFSITIGYVIPSILIAIPSPNVVSYASQQAAIAIWTPFPVWVGLAQWVLTQCEAKFSSGSESILMSYADAHRNYRWALRRVYLFALVGSAFVHIGILVTSLNTLLFPAIFAPGIRSEFALTNVLFPKNSNVGSIGAGVLSFIQWDQWIGYTALLIWALKQQQEYQKPGARTSMEWLWRGLEVVFAVALLGPGSAAVLYIWKKDEKGWFDEEQVVKAREGKLSR